MFPGQSNFLQALGWAVLNSLWQMALLWVMYQLLTGVFKTARPSHKTSLATSLIIAGFGWFLFTFFAILNAAGPDNGAITSVVINIGNNDKLNDWLSTMLPIASVAYLVLLVLPLFNFIRNYRFVQAIRRYELSKINVEWRIFVKNIAARMGIQKPVRIWLSGIVTSPVTIGYIKPVILLPIAAINQLSTEQLEAVLLHELAHIRRYDYLFNLVIRFIQSILYFNPFVKLLVKTVEREREKSCDEMVMQFQYDPHGYASALLLLEKTNYLPKPLAVAASGKRSDLLHRIEWLLGVQKKQTLSFNRLAGLFAGLLCFIALNALLIISKPGKDLDATASAPRMLSPFYFFTEGEQRKTDPLPVIGELPATVIASHAQPVAQNKSKEIAQTHPSENRFLLTQDHPNNITAGSQYMFTNYFMPSVIHELKAYEEQQVIDAVQASKKVLEDKQWKAVENKVAEVLTLSEKAVLKHQYEKEMKKVDWNQLEDKLRVAYDKIDWITVNDQLNKAITEIKMDSLRQAYTCTSAELSAIQKELAQSNLAGIPDTDISLKIVEEKKRDVQKAIRTLERAKVRKIIHL